MGGRSRGGKEIEKEWGKKGDEGMEGEIEDGMRDEMNFLIYITLENFKNVAWAFT